MDYQLLAAVRDALASGDEALLHERLRALRPADLADVVEYLEPAERQAVFALLADEVASAVMPELDEAVAATVVRGLPAERAADILEEMRPDDAADVLQDLSDEAADALLAEMTAADAQQVRELLEYPENSAGGRMVGEFVTVPESATVSQVIADLRANPPSPETAYYLYVCDPQGRLAGVVSLRDLVVANPEARVAEIMTREVVRVRADASQEEAAELVARYDLLAVPVVDAQERVVGVITVDDVLTVLEEQATEAILHLSSGAEPAPEAAASPVPTRVSRATAAVLAGFAGAAVVALFREVFTVRLAYLLFMPLVITVCEVVSGQVMAAVREALRHDAPGRLARTIGREVLVTLLVAAVGGGLLALLLGHWQQLTQTGITLGLAVLLAALIAALIGSASPLLARATHRDPAAIPVSVAAAVASVVALAAYLWLVVALG